MNLERLSVNYAWFRLGLSGKLPPSPPIPGLALSWNLNIICLTLRQHILWAWTHPFNRQVKEPSCVQPKNVLFGLIRKKRELSDRMWWIKIPVWPIGCIKQLGFSIHHIHSDL